MGRVASERVTDIVELLELVLELDWAFTVIAASQQYCNRRKGNMMQHYAKLTLPGKLVLRTAQEQTNQHDSSGTIYSLKLTIVITHSTNEFS